LVSFIINNFVKRIFPLITTENKAIIAKIVIKNGLLVLLKMKPVDQIVQYLFSLPMETLNKGQNIIA